MGKTATSDIIEHAIDLHAASRIEAASGSGNSISAAVLVRYAKRRGALLDFAIERELRRNPAAHKIYTAVLQQTSMACSPVAIAAGDGAIVKRLIASHELEIVEDNGDQFIIIRLGGKTEPAPQWLEIRSLEQGVVRLTLPKPVGRIMQMQLDLNCDEGRNALELLHDPKSSLFLIV